MLTTFTMLRICELTSEEVVEPPEFRSRIHHSPPICRTKICLQRFWPRGSLKFSARDGWATRLMQRVVTLACAACAEIVRSGVEKQGAQLLAAADEGTLDGTRGLMFVWVLAGLFARTDRNRIRGEREACQSHHPASGRASDLMCRWNLRVLASADRPRAPPLPPLLPRSFVRVLCAYEICCGVGVRFELIRDRFQTRHDRSEVRASSRGFVELAERLAGGDNYACPLLDRNDRASFVFGLDDGEETSERCQRMIGNVANVHG